MKYLSFTLLLFFVMNNNSYGQIDYKTSKYIFTKDKTVECTEVKSQDRTGTCWSFATASFLESEAIRMGKGDSQMDFSEMYVVRKVYQDKAMNYILRQGKANFSQGSLSHDLINIANNYGMVPESAYAGKLEGDKIHNHIEMEAILKGMLDGVLKQKRPSKKWKKAFEAILDVYLGEAPEKFTHNGKTYTPKSFASEMGVKASEYVNFTSYTHHPFYEDFVLEIPDNYSNGSFYNVPLEDLEKITDHALSNGYSIAWDGDVSEKGFSSKNGIAVLPIDEKREDLFNKPGVEKQVDQEMRQETFENYSTTDDHLMHLTGTAKDQKGTKYYLIKNSWGEISEHKGFIYMSDPYFKLKTVSIMVHKDAIPDSVKAKIFK